MEVHMMTSFEDILDGKSDPYPHVTRATRLVGELRKIAEWNDFAASLVTQHQRKGQLSDRQMDAAERMLAKIEQTRREREASAVSVDLSPVHAMFAAAMASGYKRPTYRAAGVALSLAPLHGRNAGAIYVKDDETGDYLGKVTPELEFRPVRGAGDVAAALAKIAADPAAEAVAYGKLTGRCSCCGRELTDPVSVERGIGPICADRWGF